MTTSWLDSLPRAVQQYLAPIQNRWLTEWLPALNGYRSSKGTCDICGVVDHNLRRHHMRHHAPIRAIFFCPIEGCPSVLIDQQGLRDHLKQNTHRGGAVARGIISAFGSQNCFWPMTRAWAAAILGSCQKFHPYIMLHALAGASLNKTFFAAKQSVIHSSLTEVMRLLRPRFADPAYNFRILKEEKDECEASDEEMPVVTLVPPVPVLPVPSRGRGRGRGYLMLLEQSLRRMTQTDSSSRVKEEITGCDQERNEEFQDAECDDPVHMIPVISVTPEEWRRRTEEDIPNLELEESRGVMHGITESPEGDVRSSVALSLPGGVEDSSAIDAACPEEPEVPDFTPEAPEGSPSSADILAVSAGASASSFPGGRRAEVPDFPGFAPSISSLITQLDDMEQVAAHQQRMLDRASYDRWIMRQSLRSLAEFAGVKVENQDLGCQCPGKH